MKPYDLFQVSNLLIGTISSVKQTNLVQFCTRDLLIYKKHTQNPHTFLPIPQNILTTPFHTKNNNSYNHVKKTYPKI